MTEQTAPATLSYTAVWEDTLRMLRANLGLLTAIAGVFLFLPALLIQRYKPQPEQSPGMEFPQFIELMSAYIQDAWAWLLIANLLNMVGIISIYLLLLASPRLTVGSAVARALPILPFFYLLTLILNAAIGLGLLLLIVPGLYLLGRLVLASPVMVVEAPHAPLTSLQRSWHLSRGRGWTIALLVALVYVVAAVVSFAVRVGIGSVLLLFLGRDGVGGLLAAILEALVNAAAAVVATVLIAAIYRAIAARVASARATA